jgi:hypothetical protein
MMNQRMDSNPSHQPHGPPQRNQCDPNVKQEDEAMVFVQGFDKKPTGKPKEESVSSKRSSSSGSVNHGTKITKIS